MTFTLLGFLLIGTLMLLLARGKTGGVVTAFLAVILLSMIVLNWSRIRPLIIRQGG